MLGFIGIIAGIALLLAVVMSGLLIGTLLVVGWITDALGGRGRRGGGRPAGYDSPPAGNARRNGPGVPAASRQRYPRRDGSDVPVTSRRDYR